MQSDIKESTIYVITIDNITQYYVSSEEEAQERLLHHANLLKTQAMFRGFLCNLDYSYQNTIGIVGRYNNFVISYDSIIHTIKYIPIKQL
jgi:hypothetical protein